MKVKVFLFLILIILIGGAVFYFGWVQFDLEEHSYGVAFSKTTGYETEVLRPGEFYWRWQALIPTNFTLHEFPVLPRTVSAEKKGSLPSGDVYGSVLEKNVSFDYRIDIEFDYSLIPELLPELVSEEGLDPDKLDEFYGRIDQELLQASTEYLEREIADFESGNSADYSLAPFREEMQTYLEKTVSSIRIKRLSVLDFQLPDIDLYRSAKDFYLSLLETRRSTEQATLEKEREWIVSEESKLQVLRKYGELFTEYPGLIQYMAIGERDQLKELLPTIDLLQDKISKGESELE